MLKSYTESFERVMHPIVKILQSSAEDLEISIIMDASDVLLKNEIVLFCSDIKINNKGRDLFVMRYFLHETREEVINISLCNRNNPECLKPKLLNHLSWEEFNADTFTKKFLSSLCLTENFSSN